MRYYGLQTAVSRVRALSTAAQRQPSLQLSRGRVPEVIWLKTAAALHRTINHPLDTLRREIEAHFHKTHPSLFNAFSDISPIVSTEQCFDDLLVPPDHPSRSPTDTYYIDNATCLRPHMTTHDVPLLRDGSEAFLLCGDVYRRDTVDRTHYPVFHQVDGVRLFPAGTSRDFIAQDLKAVLGGLARHLFGDADMRWVDAYFPFTEPSFELEVQWKGEWLELLGCGLLHRGVLHSAGVSDQVNGWAFGLGLERLAMVLYGIPDIRLFWSSDERFVNQFTGSLGDRFKPFSAYPSIEKDVSFWVTDGYHENDFCEVVRAVGGDLVENVSIIDRFEKDGRTSLCYRLIFRSMERSLTHVEINELYHHLRGVIGDTLPVTLR